MRARWPTHVGLTALGAVAALGQAPWGLWPLSLFSMAVLGFVLARRGTGFLFLWLAGAGYFLLALNWVVEPFLVDIARHGWMAPFALLFMASGLALFWGVAGHAARRWGGLTLLPAWLGLAELLRGYALTGFPWALPGYVWLDTPVRHLAAWVGPYALTALTFAAPMWMGAAIARKGGRRLGKHLTIAMAAAVVLAVPAVLPPAPAPAPSPTAPLMRLVQPNAPQREKWDPDRMPVFFRRHLELSSAPASRRPDVVIWSETAIPTLLEYAEPVLETIAATIPGTPLVSGIQRRDEEGRFYNSLIVTDGAGLVSEIYDKHHLVPFGEYVPLGWLVRRFGLRGLAERLGGYSAGPGPRTIRVGNLGIALPLICYEAVFPQDLRGTERPDFLLQITNDAWFGTASGPYQHLAQARFRAVEQGMPLVRVANTGVTAVIDARGAIRQQIRLGTQGRLDALLPPALPSTLYARTGDWPLAIVLSLLLLVGGVVGRRRGDQIFD